MALAIDIMYECGLSSKAYYECLPKKTRCWYIVVISYIRSRKCYYNCMEARNKVSRYMVLVVKQLKTSLGFRMVLNISKI